MSDDENRGQEKWRRWPTFVGIPNTEAVPSKWIATTVLLQEEVQTSKRESSEKKASRMHMTCLPILVHIFLENTKLYNKKPI